MARHVGSRGIEAGSVCGISRTKVTSHGSVQEILMNAWKPRNKLGGRLDQKDRWRASEKPYSSVVFLIWVTLDCLIPGIIDNKGYIM
jgi:hypothetical protein